MGATSPTKRTLGTRGGLEPKVECLSALGQVLAVGRDDLLVPVEALLLGARKRAVAGIVAVHVDKAVALGHLARAGAHQVDGAHVV